MIRFTVSILDLGRWQTLDRNDQLADLQRRILISHACGVGEEVPVEVVRSMMLLKAKALGQGHSAVAKATIQRIMDMLSEDIIPVVPAMDL